MLEEEAEERARKLEEKISVLLSCKNCPENKDGLICQKEYENKCLAQKIQYIKELKEENAELRDDNKVMADNYSKMEQKFYDNLTKAKEIIKILLKYDRGQFFDDRRIYEKYMRTRGEAEQFLEGE